MPQHLLVTCNWLSAFLQEVDYLKAYDVYGAAFCNISLAFNKTVSAFRLIEEGSDVNITDCGKEPLHVICTTQQPSIHINWRTIKQHFKITTDL